MPADKDFNTALKLDLLAITGSAVGLTDQRNVGWTGDYDIIDTVKQISIEDIDIMQALPYEEMFISQPLAERPDLLAYSVYGNAQLAWVLKIANNLSLNSEFVTSLKIKVPNKVDVETAFLTNRG